MKKLQTIFNEALLLHFFRKIFYLIDPLVILLSEISMLLLNILSKMFKRASSDISLFFPKLC